MNSSTRVAEAGEVVADRGVERHVVVVRPSSAASTAMARWACTYSANAWATVSSVDHSQLKPSSSALMHGFGTAARMASPSTTCTVLSSTTAPRRARP